nr:hypothetical protein [Clostridia bacterium]
PHLLGEDYKTFSFTNTKKDANLITSFFGTFLLTNDFKILDIFTYKSQNATKNQKMIDML